MKNKVIVFKKIFLVAIFFIMLFFNMTANPENTEAVYEDPNDAWTNFSNIPVSVSTGCNAQSVYAYCTFYANFWNPNGNKQFRSASVTLKRNGITVFSHTEWSQDNNHYFNWCHIPIYLQESGTYTVEKSATTLKGENLTWDTDSLTVNPIAYCPTNLTLSSSSISLNMTGTKSIEVTAKISGVLPDRYTIRYECSDSSVASCSWGGWFDSDGDGKDESDTLTITGKAGGKATVTILFSETSTDTLITSKSFIVNVGPNYTVSYHANGGSGAPSDQTKMYGKTLTLSSTRPTRSGYTFKGWATSSTASSAMYQPGGSYTSNSGTMLYAVWERNPSRPTVTITPSSTSVKTGISKTFSVSASGGYPTSYTYQWYYATSQNGTGTRISGATSSSYTISSNNMTSGLNGRYYYCVVSNGQYDVTSSRAKLTVYYAPTVTTPVSKNVTSGTSAAFSVSASGGNPDTYTYQWYYAASQSGTGTRISGATSESYTISSDNMTSGLNGRYYYCVVSNGQYDVESGRARLTVTESGRDIPTGDPTNPVHHCTGENDGSDYTDWSYVYFGSYPQSEVTGSALTSAITGASYDANGDAWVNGIKYRRISKSDTNYNGYFGDSTYRYFKWERIKWKVLKNNGSTLFVLADKGLDCKDYHDPGGDVTWENSTIRSWLNDDFYQTAFDSNERNAIVQQPIVNEDNLEYGTEGGNDTQENVYLLSIREAGNQEYGFCENYNTYSASRRVKASDYAHTRGANVDLRTDYAGNCYWWLRSPGTHPYDAAIVVTDGYVSRDGLSVDISLDACVPALHINLSSDLWSQTDDGTSGSGGIVPILPTVSSPESQSVKSGTSATFRVTASNGNPNTYTYQWYYAASQTGTGTRIDGAASSSYTIPVENVTSNLNGRYYYCVVSNGIYDVPSDRAKLTVYKAPNVTAPVAKSVEAGTGATFSVSASGGNPGTYTYQWYYATSASGTGTRINGATSSSYTISSGSMTTALNGRYYYCVVSNGQYQVASGRARLTVQSSGSSTETHTPPTVSGLSEWYSRAVGTSLELTVTASGGNPDIYTYQWYYAASETGAGTKINGAVSSTYTIPASEMTLSINNRYYYCIVSNGSYNVESRRTRIFVYNETNPGSGTGGNGISSSAQIIYASSYTKEYGSKAFFIQASTNGNGKLTYQSSNKKVAEVSSNGQVKLKGYGTAVVTIRASQTQEYKAASKQITIEVIPKKIALKKVSSPGSRRISINWKKGKKIKGYELYISSSKNFKSNTFSRVFGQSKTNTALTGLKSGKKYYVKIRSYAKVGKKKYYSEWSKIKQVKIK